MSDQGPYPAVYAEQYRKEAQRIVEVLADELEVTAARLRRQAEVFTTSCAPASGIAADIVSDYVARTGNASVRLWTVVDSAGRADVQRTLADVKAESAEPVTGTSVG